MYLRFLVAYFNENKKVSETGFFRAADYVRDYLPITKDDRMILKDLVKWFDNNMPIPTFYQDPTKRNENKKTFFWFKDTANEFIYRMNTLAIVLEKYGVEVRRIHSKKLPGKIIYEDECQIVIKPFKDSNLKIK